MLLVDVDLNTIIIVKPADPTRFFYTETAKRYTIYCLMNNVVFRYVYNKRPEADMQDELFFQNYLQSAFRIDKLKVVPDENLWKLQMETNRRLAKIESMLEKKAEDEE